MRPLLAILVCWGALLVAATAASAQSEFDQYVPDLPGPKGDVPIRDITDKINSDGGGGGNLPPGTLGDLASRGPEGAALAAIAEASAPKGAASEDGARRGAGKPGDGAGEEAADSGGSAIDSLIDLLGGADTGLGVLFPLLLALTLGAGVGYFLLRERT
jgi:hypothetical protein